MKLLFFIQMFFFFHLTYSQTISEKREFIYYSNGSLKEENYEYYDNAGKLIKDWSKDYRGDIKTSTQEYTYDEKNRLSQKVFYAQWSYIDSNRKLFWMDTSFISTKTYEYNELGLLSVEKEFSYECNFEKSSNSYYFYNEGLLKRKFCTHQCNMGYSENKYPIHYFYDKNDSLIVTQAMRPEDTTKIWYLYKSDYFTIPNGLIYERYYNSGDSLKLEDKFISKNYFNSKGLKTMTVHVDSTGLNDTTFCKYNNKNLLTLKYRLKDGNEVISKIVYKYYKNGLKKEARIYKRDYLSKNKLELRSYNKYRYIYLKRKKKAE